MNVSSLGADAVDVGVASELQWETALTNMPEKRILHELNARVDQQLALPLSLYPPSLHTLPRFRHGHGTRSSILGLPSRRPNDRKLC